MAGRKRRPENSWMPPYVKQDKYGYVYNNNSSKEYFRLCGLDVSQAEVWAAYDKLGKAKALTLTNVIEKYMKSPDYLRLKPRSQTDYMYHAKKINDVFGEMHPDTIESWMIQEFMDKRGRMHPTAANKERYFLQVIMNWGKARNYVTIQNPCGAVKPIRLKKTPEELDRSYSDADHLALYNFLGKHGHVLYQVALEIAYLCGARQQDVLRLYDQPPFRIKAGDCYITKDGIMMWQAKTNKVQLKLFTPRLKAAVDLARKWKRRPTKEGKLRKTASSPWLICTKSGTKYTRNGFNSTWIRMQAKALAEGVISTRFRFHDTKHKAITDYTGNQAEKQHFSGHRTPSMVNKYNHEIEITSTIDKPLDMQPSTVNKPSVN
jgi:hypothetical protein